MLILMATYNGEKYIRKQLDSIVAQTNEQWELLVSDDGSTDKTCQILDEYCLKDKRISWICNDSCFHGAYENFWFLINYVRKEKIEHDFYLFCDQDDIWEKKKLETILLYAQKYDESTPLLLYSDVSIIDGKDALIEPSLENIIGLSFISKYQPFFSNSNALGCTIAVNFKCFFNIPIADFEKDNLSMMYHDAWFTKYASIMGKIEFIPFSLVKYRRWGGNETSDNKLNLTFGEGIKIAFNKFETILQTHGKMYTGSLLMLDKIDEENNEEIDKLYTIISSGGYKTVMFMLKNKIHRKQKVRDIALYIIVLLKLYKKYLNDIR